MNRQLNFLAIVLLFFSGFAHAESYACRNKQGVHVTLHLSEEDSLENYPVFDCISQSAKRAAFLQEMASKNRRRHPHHPACNKEGSDCTEDNECCSHMCMNYDGTNDGVGPYTCW